MNKRLFTLWMSLTLLLFSSSLFAQNFSAQLDRDHIGIQETFTLTLRYQGSTNESPNLDVLNREFELISVHSGDYTQIINNQVNSFIEWRLTLAPRKSGVFTIPALTLGNHSTQPLMITVDPQKSAGSGNGTEIYVEVETDKKNLYVQEQLLFTVRLVTPLNLEEIHLEPPTPENALIVELGQSDYRTTINGVPHAVIESRFAFFPQRSGELVIPSLLYQVVPSTGRRGLLSQFYGTPSGNTLRLRTEEQRIEVKAVPAEAAGLPWLPASDLQLEEHWSRGLDSVKVGEPVTRSIKIIAEGLTPGQISPLVTDEQEGLTFYPDQAQNDEQKTSRGVKGTRIETQAIVPTRSGNFTLPAVRVQWWDTVNQQLRTAELPEQKLMVADNPLMPNTPPQTNQANIAPGSEPLVITKSVPVLHTPWWLFALLAFSCTASCVFALLYWRTRRDLRAIRGLFIDERQDNHIAEDKAWRLLKSASADKNYPALRKAVLTWARLHFHNPNLHSLQALVAQTQSTTLREQLLKLDSALYGNLKGDWDSGELLQAIYACKKDKRDKQKEESGLNPLYQGQ